MAKFYSLTMATYTPRTDKHTPKTTKPAKISMLVLLYKSGSTIYPGRALPEFGGPCWI